MKWSNEKIEKVLIKILWLGAIAALITPLLLINTVSNPYILTKMIALQVIVGVMLVAWIPLAISNPKYRPNFKHPIVLAATIFILVLYIGLPFGVDPARSFWSTRIRMMGVLQYSIFYLWFLILVSTFKNWRDWRFLLLISNSVAVVVGILAYAQWEGLGRTERVISSLGNPLFLAAYSLLHLFIAVILWKKEKDINWRRFYVFSILVHFSSIVFTFSRGPIVALGVSALIAVIWFLIATRKKSQPILQSLSILILGAAVASILALVWFQSTDGANWAKQHLPPTVERMVHGKVDRRLVLWRIGLEGIAQKPIFGWGFEHYFVVFNQNADRSGREAVLFESWYDRAHNELVDIGVATGIVGLAAYLALWFLVIFKLAQQIKDEQDSNNQFVLRVLILGLIAFFLQNLFIFDLPMSMLILFLLFALSVQLTGRTRSVTGQVPVKPIVVLGIFGAALIAMLPVQYFIAYQPIHRATLFEKATRVKATDLIKSREYLEQAFAGQHFLEVEFILAYSDGLKNVIEKGQHRSEEMKEILELLVAEANDEVEKEPENVKLLIAAASLSRYLAVYDEVYFDQASELAKRAQELGPKTPIPYIELGNLEIERGNYERALEYFDQAVHNTLMSTVVGLTHSRIAETHARMGDFEQAFEYLFLAQQDKYGIFYDTRLATLIAEADEANYDLATAIDYVDAVWVALPNNNEAMKARAIMHHRVGEPYVVSSMLKRLQGSAPEVAEELMTEYGMEIIEAE